MRVSPFQKRDFERGKTTPYRRVKKNMLELFRTTPFRGKKKKKKKKDAGRRRLRLKEAEPSEPSEPVTVHRTGRSDRGPDGSMLFSHGTVPYLKPTVNLNGSRVFRSDRTVRSGFNNLAFKLYVYMLWIENS